MSWRRLPAWPSSVHAFVVSESHEKVLQTINRIADLVEVDPKQVVLRNHIFTVV
jgi:hypothetical protein